MRNSLRLVSERLVWPKYWNWFHAGFQLTSCRQHANVSNFMNASFFCFHTTPNVHKKLNKINCCKTYSVVRAELSCIHTAKLDHRIH